MTFEELSELIKTAEGLDHDAVLEGIQGLVNEEKQRGISLYQKKDGELMKVKAAIKEAGFDSSKHETLKDYVKSLGQKAQSSDEDKITINTLNEKLSDLTEKFTNAERAQMEAVQKANTETLRSKLTTALGEKVYGANYVIESLIQKGEVKKLDDKVVWSVDGMDLDYDAGLEKFLKNNGDIIKSTKTNGTGVPGSTSVSGKDNADLTVEEATANISALGKEYGIEI